LYLCQTRIFLLFLVSSFHVAGQEIIYNGDFEKYQHCPQQWNVYPVKEIAKGWYNPSSGTPDYFNKCSTELAGVPRNWAGFAEPASGKAYVGLYLWQADNSNFREYLQTELTRPLQKAKYRIEFYLNLASNAAYAIDRIGLLLTDSSFFIPNDKIIEQSPTISIVCDTLLTSSIGTWKRFAIEYNARGGERFLTIGNFFDNTHTRSQKIKMGLSANSMLSNHAYYFLDNVSIQDAGINELRPVKEFELNKVYLISDINYQFGSHELQASAFPLLDSAYNYLKRNPSVRLTVNGHTDHIGSSQFNADLSLRRARSVKEYLVLKGIDASIIQLFGFGETRPITTETTEEARMKNRRVELIFTR
jgi:OmpA-OmpF porin, OOP family